MGSHKTVDMSATVDEKDTKTKKSAKKGKLPAGKKSAVTAGPAPETVETTSSKTKAKKARTRSKRYTHKRSQVDRTIFYQPQAAIELVKRLSPKKHTTLTADIVHADDKVAVEMSFPHSTGKTIKIAVVTDKLLTTIEKGETDFDVLLATPEFMPRLAKLAKILGPRGLMPNPKNGTLTPDPAKKQKQLEAGKITIKTEKKAPLIHIQIGKTDMNDQQLLENLTALATAINPDRIKKIVLSSTMSPGIRIDPSALSSK